LKNHELLNGTWTTEPKDESLQAMKPDGTANGSPHQRRGNEWASGRNGGREEMQEIKIGEEHWRKDDEDGRNENSCWWRGPGQEASRNSKQWMLGTKVAIEETCGNNTWQRAHEVW
jgi:hypothetical protein